MKYTLLLMWLSDVGVNSYSYGKALQCIVG
jgi:hypothetical protein